MVLGTRKKHSDCLRGGLLWQANDQIGDALVARLRCRHFGVAVAKRQRSGERMRALMAAPFLGEAGGPAIRRNLHSGCGMEVPNHID